MKNKFLVNLFNAILVVLFCTTNFAYAKIPHLHTIKVLAMKYYYIVAFVVGFILLCVGISLYRKIVVSSQLKNKDLTKESLKSPTDVNEAIMMFINKNRLR